jgi:hypothetical protein
MQFCQQQTWKRLSPFVLLLAMIGTGCGRYSHVNWGNPGTAEMQKNRALAEHDPYPDPELAPVVDGGRPLGYQTPPAEAAWLQRRDPLHRSPHGYQQSFTAQPIYTTPAYSPNVLAPTAQPNVLAPTAQPNYSTPVYQPSFMPSQTVQPAQPGYPMQ